jgi:predicted nucleotidyltransferase
VSDTVQVDTQLLQTVPQLPEIVDRLVRRFDPLRIILFGSWARGDTHRWSDVDLLMVLPEAPFEDKIELMVDALNTVSDLPVAKDIIVTDPDEIARRGQIIGTVLRPALREGKVVYERA